MIKSQGENNLLEKVLFNHARKAFEHAPVFDAKQSEITDDRLKPVTFFVFLVIP